MPVKAYTAAAAENGQLRLNQLHEACHGPIKYQKTCPLHGTLSSDQIVMGYQRRFARCIRSSARDR